jgi:chromosome segregation ATPase
MSKVSLADTLLEWGSLVAAMDQSGQLDAKPYLREFRDQLDAMLTAVKALASEQADLEGRRQGITQQLRIARSQGQELAINIRSVLKGAVGYRNEGLVRYNIRPIRSRSRSRSKAAAAGPAPELADGTQSQPS